MTPEDGVTIKLYGPSAAFPGTLIVPKKNPWSWDEVVFEAIVTAPERSSIVRSTFGIPVEPALSRTYPLTLSALPGSTVWPPIGVRNVTYPCGGRDFWGAVAVLFPSWGGPPLVVAFCGLTLLWGCWVSGV